MIGICLHRRGARRPRDRGVHATRCRRCTRSSTGVERFRHGPGARRGVRPARPRRLRDRGARGRRGGAAPGAVRRAAAASIIDHHASQRRRRATPTGSTRAPPRPASSSPCSPSAWACRSTAGGRRAGRRAHGRHRHGHRDVRAPQRDAAHAGRLGGARGGRRAALGHLAPAVPDQARHPAPAVRPGPGPSRDLARPARDLVHAPLEADLAATGSIPAHSEGIIDLLAQSETAEVAMLLKEQADGTTRLSVRTKPGGVDATVLTGRLGRRRPRPGRRCVDPAAARGRGGGRARAWPSAWPPRCAGEPARPPRRARRRARRRQAVRSHLARRRRARASAVVARGAWVTAARSTRSPRASCRCSWAGRRGWSSTTSATPSATGRRSASASRPRRTTSTASGRRSTGPPVTREAVEAGAARHRSGRCARCRRSTAPSRSTGGAPTRWRAPGEVVELAPRDVVIQGLDLLEWDDSDPARPVAVVDVALLGRAPTSGRWPATSAPAWSTGAYLGALVRTASGRFRLDDAISFDTLREHAADGPAGIVARAAADRRRPRGPAARPDHRRRGPAPGRGPDRRRPRRRSRSATRRSCSSSGRTARSPPSAAPSTGVLHPHKVLAAAARHATAGRTRAPDAAVGPPDACTSPAASTACRASEHPAFVVVGVFDGLHLGHQYLLDAPRRRGGGARRPAGGRSRSTTTPTRSSPAPRRRCCAIPTSASRAWRRRAWTPTVVVHFDQRLRETHVRRVRRADRRPRGPLAGLPHDARRGVRLPARRGRRRRWPSSAAEQGFDVVVVPPFELDGRPVRSTEVRAAIASRRPRPRGGTARAAAHASSACRAGRGRGGERAARSRCRWRCRRTAAGRRTVEAADGTSRRGRSTVVVDARGPRRASRSGLRVGRDQGCVRAPAGGRRGRSLAVVSDIVLQNRGTVAMAGGTGVGEAFFTEVTEPIRYRRAGLHGPARVQGLAAGARGPRQADGRVAPPGRLLLALVRLGRPRHVRRRHPRPPVAGRRPTRWPAPATRLAAAFEFFTKLGIPYYCFHDRDVAPEGAASPSSATTSTRSSTTPPGTRSRPASGCCGARRTCSRHPRYQAGAATNPDPEVFAYAAAQVKHMLEVTQAPRRRELRAVGRPRGLRHAAQHRPAARGRAARPASCTWSSSTSTRSASRARSSSSPSRMEPTKHQYDYDTADGARLPRPQRARGRVQGQHRGEPRHARGPHASTTRWRTRSRTACSARIDANRGDPQNGWDTDQFPNSVDDLVLPLYEILRAGGLGTGGFNFDAKLRRQSIDRTDLFHAHIGGLDTIAHGAARGGGPRRARRARGEQGRPLRRLGRRAGRGDPRRQRRPGRPRGEGRRGRDQPGPRAPAARSASRTS